MMISNLITKYLNGNATEKEVAEIFEWIEISEANKNEFIALKKAWAVTPVSVTPEKTELKNLKKELSNKNNLHLLSLLKYAAILLLFFTIGGLLWTTSKAEQKRVNEVVLEIGNSDSKIKIKDNSQNIKDTSGKVIAEQNKDEIVYPEKLTDKPIIYHTLNIPYGKTFKISLSDGSIVHLNAGSSLKYPEQFSASSSRRVYLKGEAFFDIKKDEAHPFIVSVNDVAISVLGTSFNVNSYSENRSVACVLVEGSVKLTDIENPNNTTLLEPNEKASWQINSKIFDVKQVENTNLYTSWIHGELNFETLSFNKLSKKLERSFNVEIINNNEVLKQQEFTGTLNMKNNSIKNILDLLRIDTPFKYSIENNVVKIYE